VTDIVVKNPVNGREMYNLHVHDAIAEVFSPECLGRLVEILLEKKVLTAADVQVLLPHWIYEVRE